MRGRYIALLCLIGTAGFGLELAEVEAGLMRAARFFREEVSTEGGYLWSYSEDLALREGENVADALTVWVQPPGTPSVGLAFLRAWQVTGDKYYLAAAQAAGRCLVRGQMRSGGWQYLIPFDAERRKGYDFRTDPVSGAKKLRLDSTLDDNTTQEALRFLALLDEALEFADTGIHEATVFGLTALLKAQFPNGGFSQTLQPAPVYDIKDYPVKQAEYPPEGVEPTHVSRYQVFYTLNDNLLHDVNRLFFAAWEVYTNEVYLAAARRVGDFVKLAQMPEPQPAWAQQYDFQMRPCWARKFEPAAVTGGESQSTLRALAELFIVTGEAGYLEPIPRAIEYLKRSRLEDGRLARFYEMRTNRPLYFTTDYKLTYEDNDLPTHYSFKVPLRVNESWLGSLGALSAEARVRELGKVRQGGYRALAPSARGAQKDVARILKAMDNRGRWLRSLNMRAAKGERVRGISCSDFIRNVAELCAYIEAEKRK